MTQRAFLNSIKQGAIEGWHTNKILPSITGAQAALESGWGSSTLSKPPNNNVFGIKSSSDWHGRTVNMPTQEWTGGRYITINADFRAYDSRSDSVRDHSNFFTSTEWRKNNYRAVIGEKNYRTAAHALRSAGYATDPNYPTKLIQIIESYGLSSWDTEAFSGAGGSGTQYTPPTSGLSHTVGGALTSSASSATSGMAITVIGDSLGVGTMPYLRNFNWQGISSNNQNSRQWSHSTLSLDALRTLQNMLNQGNVNEYVVMILGTNRGVNASEIRQAVDMIGSRRKLVLVDTASEVGHRERVSVAYTNAANSFSNVFHVNWNQYARSRVSSWYHADGAGGTRIHMNATGYKQHANYIVQGLYQIKNTNWNKAPTETTSKLETTTKRADISHLVYKDQKFSKPKGENIIYNSDLNDIFGFRLKDGRKMWVEHHIEVDDDDPEFILQAGLEYMKAHSAPETEYTVDLTELPAYIGVGDEGVFVDHEFNPPLYIQARVMEISTSFSDPSRNKVVIGNVKELEPQEKSDIIRLQEQLQDTRENLLHDYLKGAPIVARMEAEDGLTITNKNYTEPKELIEVKNKVGEEGYILELEKPTNWEDKFVFTGTLKDNYIMGQIDAVETPTGAVEEKEFPEDETSNPQGEAIPVAIVESDDFKGLLVNELEYYFLDKSGSQVGSTYTVAINLDNEFYKVIEEIPEGAASLRLTASNSANISLEAISFVEVGKSSSGATNNTKLVARAFQDDRDVTDRFKFYQWTRISDNPAADVVYNEATSLHNTLNYKVVAPDDLEGEKSIFLCRFFDDNNNLVATASAEVKMDKAVRTVADFARELGYNSLSEFVTDMQGKDGKDGIAGATGKDGKTQYLHIAWANNPMGRNFSLEYKEGQSYMGTYVDDVKADSTDWTRYEWVRVKGDKGDKGDDGRDGKDGKDGKQGEAGKDGANLHIAWANNASGKDFSTETADNRTYIGYVTSTDKEPPNDWRVYEWQKMAEVYAQEFGETIREIGDAIRVANERAVALSTEVDQTKESYMITHEQEIIRQVEYTATLSNALNEQIRLLREYQENVKTYFEFSDALRIGKSNSTMQLRMDNEELAFLDGDTKSAYINANQFHAQNLVAEDSLIIGKNHKFETDGVYTIIRYIGGD